MRYKMFCYNCNLYEYHDKNPVCTIDSDSMEELRKFGAYYLYRSVFMDSKENSCYVIYDMEDYNAVCDDWGQGRPAPRVIEECRNRLMEKAGLK